jgi:signal transduction histidine kinase/ActR/RegA family two-component response regulator
MIDRQTYHDLFMQAPVLMAWLRGPTFLFAFANQYYVQTVGARELIGRTMRDALPELEGQPYHGILQRVYRTGEPFSANEMPAMLDRHRNGLLERRFFNFIYQPTRDADGTINGVLIVGSDVTSQTETRLHTEQLAQRLQLARQAADLARERAVRLQAVTTALARALTLGQVCDVILHEGRTSLGAAATSLSLVDDDGAYLELVGQLGYPPETVVAWRRPPTDGELPMMEVLRTGRLVQVPRPGAGPLVFVPLVLDRHTSGVFSLCYTQPRPLGDEERAFMLTVSGQCAQAIDRVRLYELSDRRLRAAEAATRVKDEFLRTVSHELRTPVSVMKVWTEVLGRSSDETTRTRALAAISDAVRAQSRMIEDMVDASRLATGKFALSLRPTELEPLIEVTLAAARRRAQAKQIALVFERPAEGTVVEADPDRLQQIIGNLLSNAVNFTPPGGRITVSLVHDGTHAEITVSDTGEGIAHDFLPFVFEAFRQGDNSSSRDQGGLGLGLSIVFELVRRHNGTVVARSAGVGQGATFVVRLPVLPRAPDRAQPLPAPDEETLAGLVLLVVDDQAAARDGLAVLLARAGAEVIVADSTDEALVALDRQSPDLVLSDLGMPERDGFELIRAIRGRNDDRGRLPAIAFSDYATAADRERALAAGFDRHLSKSASFVELVELVAELIEHAGARRRAAVVRAI